MTSKDRRMSSADKVDIIACRRALWTSPICIICKWLHRCIMGQWTNIGVVDGHRCGWPSQVWWTVIGMVDRLTQERWTITGAVDHHRCGGRTQVWRTITGVVDQHRCGGPTWVWLTVTGVVDHHRCGGWTQVWRTVTGVVDGHRCGGPSQVWWTVTVWGSEWLFNSAVGVRVQIVNHQHLRVETWHAMFPVNSRYTRVLTTHTVTHVITVSV